MRLCICFATIGMLLFFSSCARIAIMAAPKKSMIHERSDAAIEAGKYFWDRFHAGDYDRIDEILTKLKAAYFEDPRDWLTASHIGFAHAWRYAERSRFRSPSPTMTDDAELARFYFGEAYKLNAKDARAQGFLAHMAIVSGFIHKDEKRIREGYFLGLDAIRAWPEFNLFTLAFVMSNEDPLSKRFKEGISWLWQVLDICTDGKFDRDHPDYSPFMKEEVRDKASGNKRACWNSWIAPHNVEGFFLNMGDMLLKAGEKNAAIAMYSNARLTDTYAQWPYQHVVEQRLIFAREAKEGFADQYAPKPMMFNSSYSCMACHQTR